MTKISIQPPVFEIKYEIFEDAIEELKTIDVGLFDKEWHQIYGSFTLVVGGHDSALKYVENPWTWLKIQVDNDIQVVI